ncbi:uncharacterized protein ACRADG_010253 [Cochliomyia hominivorax]
MNISKFTKIIVIILLQNLFKKSSCSLIFKNVNCQSFDESYAIFKDCNISKGRVSLYVQLLQIPITNCIIQIQFSSVPKGPVNVNLTWNACDFMKNRRRFRSLMVFYDVIGENSNLNHSCPYNHDVIVKMNAENKNFFVASIGGLYKYSTLWFMDKKLRVKVEGLVEYINIKNKDKTSRDSRKKH